LKEDCLVKALRLYILAEMGLNQNLPFQMPSWTFGRTGNLTWASQYHDYPVFVFL